MHKSRTTTDNLRNNGRLIIEILDKNDLAVGIRGDAEVLKEPMDFNEAMTLWEMEVEEVKLDTSPVAKVLDGITKEPRSERGRKFIEQGGKEMQEYI